jgi:hypothetical protein
VLIAAPDRLAALEARIAAGGAEVLAFTDSDALRALAAITTRRPSVVSLQQQFAASPRGAALINRIKADPALSRSEIRIMSPDVEPTRPTVLPVPPRPDSPGAAALPGALPAPISEELDPTGTRRAPRCMIHGTVDVSIDGNPATLVDLSTGGAQVVSPTVLKPNQRIRMLMADKTTALRTSGIVAWASFEIPSGSSPRYRAGIAFVNPDAAALHAFCLRHGA